MSRELENSRRALEPVDPFAEKKIFGQMLPQESVGVLEAKRTGGKRKKGHSKPEIHTQTKVNTEKAKNAGSVADVAQGQRKG